MPFFAQLHSVQDNIRNISVDIPYTGTIVNESSSVDNIGFDGTLPALSLSPLPPMKNLLSHDEALAAFKFDEFDGVYEGGPGFRGFVMVMDRDPAMSKLLGRWMLRMGFLVVEVCHESYF
jgi:hypothetical protein